MHCCCYFKHGIGSSNFRKSSPCCGAGVPQGGLISPECLRWDLWHPVHPDNTCGKSSPGISVTSQIFGIAAWSRSAGVSACLGTDWSIPDSFYLMLCHMSEIFHCAHWADGPAETSWDDWDYFLEKLPLVWCTLTGFAQKWCLHDLGVETRSWLCLCA